MLLSWGSGAIRAGLRSFSDDGLSAPKLLGARGRHTYVNVFYRRPIPTLVRCHTAGGKGFNLHFCATSYDHVGLLPSNSLDEPMSPEQAASFLIELMVQWIRGGNLQIY